MKNIIKAIVLFASVISFTSANAGTLEVTGTAKVTYNMQGSGSTDKVNENGKEIGITNELAFTGTGEMDNGWTWKYQVELDDNASGNTTSDDSRLELTTGYGTVAAYNTEGGLSTKYKFSAAAYGAGSDNGDGGNIVYGEAIDSYNNVQYHTPAGLLPFETSFKFAVAPNSSKKKVSGNSSGQINALGDGDKVYQYQVMTSPVEGLSLYASYLEKENEGNTRLQGYQTGGFGGKYAISGFTIGYGEHFVANNIDDFTSMTTTTVLNTAALKASVKGFENKAFSLGYTVNDNLSLSVEREYSEAQKRTAVGTGDTKANVELEIDTLQAAYTMGGMTMSISQKDLDNVDYVSGRKGSETLFAVVMAF